MTTSDRINITLPSDLRAAATAYATERGLTFSGLLRMALLEVIGSAEPPASVTLSDEQIKAIARAVADAVRSTASP